MIKHVASKDGILGEVQEGLKALGSNSNFIKAKSTRKLCGSIDLDAGYKQSEPNSSRWDYVVCYDTLLYFIEVHPATGDKDAKQVIKKLEWLINKLRSWSNARSSSCKQFFYIHTDKNAVSRKMKLTLANQGISLCSPLDLPYM